MELELSDNDSVLDDAVSWVVSGDGLPFPVYLELEILATGRDPDTMRYELEEIFILT